jgi:AcrR family transcriptional regulator
MGRSTLHSATTILDSARTVVLDGGAQAATINAIAGASSAPAGSIYHRFGSRDALLAELWIRAVRRSQAHFTAAIDSEDRSLEAAIAGALSIFDFAASERDDARLLASLRREDLIRSPLPPELVRSLRELNRPRERAVSRLARELYGTNGAGARELVALAVIDIPYGAVRRHLVGGAPVPQSLRPGVERAIRAVLDRKPTPRPARRSA